MKRLLARANLGLIERLASSPLLLAFDFDGTLAPIVPDRARATMRAETSRLFELVCRVYPCAVVSGRSRDDVKERLGGAAVKYVIGNHGAESGLDPEAFDRETSEARRELEVSLRGVDGVEIEDKRHSLAIHYRHARDKRGARAAIERAACRLSTSMRVVPGKVVVNVVADRAPSKGDAVLRLRALEGAASAIYVGDDVTDEDVFATGDAERLVGVRVGASKRSAAQYYLRNQREIDALLSRLERERTKERVA